MACWRQTAALRTTATQKRNVRTGKLQLATAVCSGTVLKIVTLPLVSCIYHASNGKKASSSRSATEGVRPSEARDSHVEEKTAREEKGNEDDRDQDGEHRACVSRFMATISDLINHMPSWALERFHGRSISTPENASRGKTHEPAVARVSPPCSVCRPRPHV